MTLDEKLHRLRSLLGELESALVAFSGGVDSTFLLRVAHDVLGSRCLALTTVSPTTPADDLEEARTLAAAMGVEHLVVDTNELAIAGYAENPTNRCYFCKDNLFVICAAEAAQRGLAIVLDGANLDDLGDHRPGLTAASDHGVRHPLVEAGLTKADIREASRALGLPTWDRPASPCLSSRFPYGTRITADRLARVAAAEDWLRAHGFARAAGALPRGARARRDCPGRHAARARVAQRAGRGVPALRLHLVALDLQGFRSGSLNEALAAETHEGPGDEPPAPRPR